MLDELKRSFTVERLVALAGMEGLESQGERIQCPARCSEDPRGATVDASENGAVWCCQRCRKGGSAVDLVMATRNMDLAQAAEVLDLLSPGVVAAPKRPVVERNAEDLWESFAEGDAAGMAYLRGRGLEPGALVRFNVGRSSDKWLNAKAGEGYRVALALRDKTGRIRQIQMRAIRPEIEPRQRCLPGGFPEKVAFGDPVAAAAAPEVHLTEGMADTIAVAMAGVVVLGAPGVDQVRHLMGLVGEPAGRTFVLHPQIDEPNPRRKGVTSEEAFGALREQLEERGATVHWHGTPAGVKDPADWLKRDGPLFLARVRGEVSRIQTTPEGNTFTVLDGGAAVAVAPEPATGRGPLKRTYGHLVNILRDPKIRGLVMGEGELEFNSMLLMPTFRREPLEEHHLSELREQVEVKLRRPGATRLTFSPADVAAAVLQVAHEKSYHPVRDYLRGLRWDGSKRLDSVAQGILHAEPTALNRTLVRKWILGAAARALYPGVKMDTVLIVVGPQEAGKSAFFKVLADGDQRERLHSWFSDTIIDLSQKDALLLLHRVWIYEWGELEVMQRARDVGAVKAFVTSQSDFFRRPYERTIKSNPRPSVLGGSANVTDFLTDPSGNRRYWPLKTSLPVDIPLLESQRDQLWAEAAQEVMAWNAAGRPFPAPWMLVAEREDLREIHELYMRPDAWEDGMVGWLTSNPGPVTISRILGEVIQKPAGQWTRADEMRVAAILKRQGYERRRSNIQGERVYQWYKGAEEEVPF